MPLACLSVCLSVRLPACLPACLPPCLHHSTHRFGCCVLCSPLVVNRRKEVTASGVMMCQSRHQAARSTPYIARLGTLKAGNCPPTVSFFYLGANTQGPRLLTTACHGTQMRERRSPPPSYSTVLQSSNTAPPCRPCRIILSVARGAAGLPRTGGHPSRPGPIPPSPAAGGARGRWR